MNTDENALQTTALGFRYLCVSVFICGCYLLF